MPRRLRLHLPGGFYHVTLRGNHQADIFFVDADRESMGRLVACAMEKAGARIHAYCWMRNHIHLLIQVGNEPLGGAMRQIASTYARAMQRRLRTAGHFFERRYHATLVDANSYLLELLRYIHLNPVRAGLVAGPAEYPWSSHHSYVMARSEPWVTTDFCMSMFGDDRVRAVEAYRDFVACTDDPPWQSALNQGSRSPVVLGDDDFIARVMRAPQTSRRPPSLDELISEACRRFEVEPVRLNSPTRDAYLTKVRAWIAYQACKRGVCTRSAVARALGRSEATLRYAIKTYPVELE